MNHKIGDLIWVPESTTLVWALKEDKMIKRTLLTSKPDIALIVSEFDENHFTIFHRGDYWVIKKVHTYEVPDVSNA
jgi:hypothetical protein